jgi:hypothetical protein
MSDDEEVRAVKSGADDAHAAKVADRARVGRAGRQGVAAEYVRVLSASGAAVSPDAFVRPPPERRRR